MVCLLWEAPEEAMFYESCLQISCLCPSLGTDLKNTLAQGEGFMALEMLTWMSYRTAGGRLSSAASPVPIPGCLQDAGACRRRDACQSLQKQGNRCAGRNKEERAAACLGEREGAFLQEGRKLLRHGRGAALPLFEVLTSLRGRSWSHVLMLLCSLNFLSPFSPREALSLLTALHNAQ